MFEGLAQLKTLETLKASALIGQLDVLLAQLQLNFRLTTNRSDGRNVQTHSGMFGSSHDNVRHQ